MKSRNLRKPAKRKGATRVIISGFKRNIYFIDLIDFSSKQDKMDIQKVLGSQKSTGFHKNRGYKYVLVCIDGYSKYMMTRRLKSKSATKSHACDEGYHSNIYGVHQSIFALIEAPSSPMPSFVPQHSWTSMTSPWITWDFQRIKAVLGRTSNSRYQGKTSWFSIQSKSKGVWVRFDRWCRS